MQLFELFAAVAALKSTAAYAQKTRPQPPNYTRTPAELAAAAPTGGAGGSGKAKVTVVRYFPTPPNRGLTRSCWRSPHAQIAAHYHAGDRVGTVVRGTWHFGYGRSFSQAALRTLSVGSVYTEPSGAGHFAATGDEAVVVLITGTAPIDTVYENPVNDPSRHH